MVDACSAVFFLSSYCLLRTVGSTLFCFTRSVFIVSCQCFVSWWQFCPLTGGFSGWWSWMLCSFFFDRCFTCWICSNCWFNTDSFLAQRITVQVISAASQKYYLKYFYCFFLPVLFFVMAILSVNQRVYVSDGWFLTSVWWFGANQVPHSPKSPAWNHKSPIWNITLWLPGIIIIIIAITKQSTDRK